MSNLTNKLNEAFDGLNSYTMNEETESIKDMADRVYSKVEANYKGSEINPESIYRMVLSEIPADDDENVRYQVMTEIMSDWEWIDPKEQEDWETYMADNYGVYLKDMYGKHIEE